MNQYSVDQIVYVLDHKSNIWNFGKILQIENETCNIIICGMNSVVKNVKYEDISLKPIGATSEDARRANLLKELSEVSNRNRICYNTRRRDEIIALI
jgi:hypothetical protein